MQFQASIKGEYGNSFQINASALIDWSPFSENLNVPYIGGDFNPAPLEFELNFILNSTGELKITGSIS